MIKLLKNLWHDERGAIAMYFALLTPVFVLIGAVVIDLSRQDSFNTQIQNFVDAAALAGAKELDKQLGARDRALEAARNVLANTQDFAYDGPQILLDGGLCPVAGATPDANDSAGCVYFLKRLPTLDTDPINHSVATDPNSDLSTGDSDTLYIEVRVNRRSMRSLMLNALASPSESLDTGAVAVAGQNQVICEVPGFFMCNPLEDPTNTNVDLDQNDIDDLNDLRGTEFKAYMKQGGGEADYLPGDWGLICPLGTGNCNVGDAQEVLATATGGCFPIDEATTKPGVTPLHVIAAVNVRFDWYTQQASNGGNQRWRNLPGYYPALNVTQGSNKQGNNPNICMYDDVGDAVPMPPFTNAVALGRDDGCMGPPDTCANGVREGLKTWNHVEYMQINHGCDPAANPTCKPSNWDTITNSAPWPAVGLGSPRRYDIYRWEIENAADAAGMTGGTIFGGIVEPGQDPPVAPNTTIEEGIVGTPTGGGLDVADCANPSLLPPDYASGDDNVDYFPNWDDLDNLGLLNDRRLLRVAVINCIAMDVNDIKNNGRFNFELGEMAVMFITEPMELDASESALYTEWVGMVTPEVQEQLVKRLIQLYRRNPEFM